VRRRRLLVGVALLSDDIDDHGSLVTVVLARALLAERVARSQEAGVALTLAGVALISLG
jgi:uncharacterized membrane protein